MKNETDLSKAYAGQIATLQNGRTILIDKIVKTMYRDIHQSAKCLAYLINPDVSGFMFFKDGSDTENQIEFNIVSIQDSIPIQCARIEGEIKGLEWAMKISTSTHDKGCIMHAIDDLKEQLLTLQNNQ